MRLTTTPLPLPSLALALLLAAGASACSEGPTPGPDTGTDIEVPADRARLDAGADAAQPDLAPADAATADAPLADGAGLDLPPDGSCPPGESVAVALSQGNGYPDRIYVPVRYSTEEITPTDAILLMDTGSALTFLDLPDSAPDYVPEVGTVQVGSCSRPVPGRRLGREQKPPVEGRPVVGTLGADYLLAQPSELDLRDGLLVRHAEVPAATRGWPEVTFEDVQGHIIATVIVDDQTLRLLVDTGSPDILWLGEEGRPEDQEVQTSDAEGNLLTLYYGTSILQMGGEAPIEVPVLRAPSFPYFEETVRILGGNIQGLLGLSALGARRVVVDPSGSRLRLEPRP